MAGNFPFEVSIGLAQNLLWFADLKHFNDTAHLRTIVPEN